MARQIPMSLERLSKLSLKGIRGRLAELKNADPERTSIDNLKAKLYGLLRAYTSVSLNVGEDRPIFRARKHREVEWDKLLDNVEEIYPQEIYITRPGRANREGQPIFYFSADSVVCLHEVKAVVGDICTVLECKPGKKATPLLIPIGIYEMARRQNRKIGGNLPEPALRIREFLKNDVESIKKHELIDHFIAEEFLKVVDEGQEQQYKLTIAIAELLFSFESAIGPIDGITYPSLASNQVNANVALLPEAFHRIYKPVSCEWMRIEKILPNLGFEVSSRKSNRIYKRNIEW